MRNSFFNEILQKSFNATYLFLLSYAYILKIVLVCILIVILKILEILYYTVSLYILFVYTKVLLDQLSFFNPYSWPLYIIQKLIRPYLKFWMKIMPKVYYGRSLRIDLTLVVAVGTLYSITRLILSCAKEIKIMSEKSN